MFPEFQEQVRKQWEWWKSISEKLQGLACPTTAFLQEVHNVLIVTYYFLDGKEK